MFADFDETILLKIPKKGKEVNKEAQDQIVRILNKSHNVIQQVVPSISSEEEE